MESGSGMGVSDCPKYWARCWTPGAGLKAVAGSGAVGHERVPQRVGWMVVRLERRAPLCAGRFREAQNATARTETAVTKGDA
jgi:hypothetical protein